MAPLQTLNPATWVVLLSVALVLLIALGRFKQPGNRHAKRPEKPKPAPPTAYRISPKLGKMKWQQRGTRLLTEQFKGLGFVSAGRYSIPEIPGLQLWLGVHAEQACLGVVYDHALFPPWFLVTRLDVRHNIYGVTNSILHDARFLTSESVCLVRPELYPAEAFTLVQSLPPKHAVLVLSRQTCKRALVHMHARQVDAMLSGAMPDATTVLADAHRVAVASASGLLALDDSKLNEAVAQAQRDFKQAIRETMIDRFVVRNDVPSSRRQLLHERGTVIHKHLFPAEVVALALKGSGVAVTDPRVQALLAENRPAADLFDRLQGLVPEDRRLSCIGEVALPLPGRIYLQEALSVPAVLNAEFANAAG